MSYAFFLCLRFDETHAQKISKFFFIFLLQQGTLIFLIYKYIYAHTHTHTHTLNSMRARAYFRIYLHIFFACMCVCVCVFCALNYTK